MQKLWFFARGKYYLNSSLHKRPNFVFLMKAKLICATLTTLTCQVIASPSTFGQNVNTSKVDVNYTNVTLKKALVDLSKRSGLNFFYPSNIVSKYNKVSVSSEDGTVADILNELLEGTELNFDQRGKNVVISVKNNTQATNAAKTLQKSVSGIVLSESGAPLPGVTVMAKVPGESSTSSKVYTATDQHGHWSLNLTNTQTVLVFSMIGYDTQEISLNGRSNVEVKLKIAKEQKIEDVVVTGIFTRSANTYTGAVTNIKGEELIKSGNTNIIASLKNIDPSFMVVDNLSAGSNPNATPTIQMRGQTGFSNVTSEQSNPNQPLFILDGFETTLTKILDLDINQVQSVTLLKDATAKALYGVKAGNGVVVVETKRPEQGKLRISYNGNANIEVPDLSSYNLVNASEKVEIERLAGLYTAKDGSVLSQISLDRSLSELLKKVDIGINTDWLNQPLRVGLSQRHSLQFDGGDQNLLYNVNLMYNNVAGVMKGSDRKTLSGSQTLIYRKNNFQFRNKLDIDNNNSFNSPYGSFEQFALMNPYQPFYDELGNLARYGLNGLRTQANPLWNGSINTVNKSNYTTITENFYAEYRLKPQLRLTSRFGVMKTITGSDDFKPASHTDFFSYSADNLYKAGRYVRGEGGQDAYYLDLGTDYNFSKDKHQFFTNFMASLANTSSDSKVYQAEGFPSEDLKHISSAVNYYGAKPSGRENIIRTLGVIGSLNYSYDNRFLFDGNYRLNGSSEFGTDKRWGNFWSAGLGWNLHNEQFIQDLDWVTMLRLRGSTGFTGTQGFSTFDAVSTLQYYTNQQYAGKIGSYLQGLANPDLQWQKKYDNNIGIDFSIKNGLLAGRAEVYEATTKGLITTITTPQSMGFASMVANLGEAQNKGFELYLTSKIYNNPSENSFVNLFTSIASNSNKLVKVANALKAKNEQSDNELNSDASKTTLAVRYEEGASMNAIWAVPSLGIDPETGREVFLNKDGSKTYLWDSRNQIVVGDYLPKYSGNFGLNGEYKGVGFSSTFTWQHGGQLYNTTLLNKVENASIYYNVDSRVRDNRWTKPGDVAQFKSIADESYTQPTSRFVQDNNILRLATMNVYYDFRNTQFLKNSRLQRLRTSFYMNDVFTLSSIRIERGTDYPFARTFMFSIQAGF